MGDLRTFCRYAGVLLRAFALLAGLQAAAAQTVTAPAVSVPLVLPGGLVFDAAGDLIFAESGSHVVRQVTPGGGLVLVAGSGVQGFAGDGGPAAAAELDSPAAVALDARGNLFIADTHNHRIRRVDAALGIITTFAGNGTAGTSVDGTPAISARIDLPVALAIDLDGDVFFADARAHLVRRIDAATGTVRTVAGSGVQGFEGDGGPAVAAALDSPYGLALDTAGDLLVADTHNQRVRRVDAATGIVTTIAGTGLAGFQGEGSAGASARLTLPRGLIADAQGNLFLVDAGNQRIRRVDAVTGQISTIAGAGVQGFAGDGGQATSAEVNAPRAVALSAAGLLTLADSSNGRLRQVDAAGVIHTYAGLGALAGETLTLAAPSVIRYGTGSLTATLGASPATGEVTLFSDAGASRTPLASAALSANAATFPTSALAAGSYRLDATYAGDSSHPPAASGTIGLSVSPAPVVATPNSVSLLYGQPVPVLTGTLAGVLPQDSSTVALNLSSAAGSLSPPASYPISVTLTGAAAGNYALSATAGAVVIAQAPAVATLTAGQALLAHVSSTTAGTPSGIVTLLDGATQAGSQTLSASGDATFPTGSLATGSHTLRAAYQGDTDFLAATSAPVLITIAAPTAIDFNLAVAGSSALSVPSGSVTQFAFVMTPVNGALSSAIQLTATGLPRGAVASFSPAYLPPSATSTAFTMAIQTPRAALTRAPGPVWAWLLLPLGLLMRVRRRRLAGPLAVLLFATGCGNRVYVAPAGTGVSYNITVTGTATSTNGAVLVHSVNVVLTVD